MGSCSCSLGLERLAIRWVVRISFRLLRAVDGSTSAIVSITVDEVMRMLDWRVESILVELVESMDGLIEWID